MIVPPDGRERARGPLPVRARCQGADDEQADADAAEPAAVAGLALDEPVEDPLVIAVGDADALVLHRDLVPAAAPHSFPGPWFPRPCFPRHPGTYPHRAAVGRVLEGVLEQLTDDDVGGHR